MNTGFRLPFVFVCVLRVTHIALWMTIPTVFWLWLGSEPPAECVPKYGWYQGNVLCVSEDTHLWIVFGLFLAGFFVIGCWVNGYCFDIVSRMLRGDKQLPPLRMMSAIEGCRLLLASLKYWLSIIAYLIVVTIFAGTLPLETRNDSYHTLLLLGAPVMLVMHWGHLVGVARFAANGERTLIYRRRENARLALTNIKATLALTGLLVALPILCAVAWTGLSLLLVSWREAEFMIEAALGTFCFYFLLLTCCVACSRLVARYALKIGIGVNLKTGETLGLARSGGLKPAT